MKFKKLALPVIGLGSLVAVGSAHATAVSDAVTGLTASAADAGTVGGGVISVVLAIVGVTIIVGMIRKA